MTYRKCAWDISNILERPKIKSKIGFDLCGDCPFWRRYEPPFLNWLGRVVKFSIFRCAIRDWLYAGGKITPWAAVLDELARELDIVIIVAAGNYRIPAELAEEHFRDYPRYLIAPHVRILEPATAVIPLTVGALAESAAVPTRAAGNVGLQPVAGEGEPAPFTRCGPGVNDVVKPELCEFGGNLLFDGAAQNLALRRVRCCHAE